MKQVLFLFCCFVVYSFLGWICETVYCSIIERRFVNRGFLNGPFCPVYGFGALLILLLFSRYRDDLVALFLLSMVVTSALEYAASFLLEKLFHMTLWNYSGRRWNINGRVCLRNSVLFGVMGVLMVRLIHPGLIAFFAWLPHMAVVIFVGVLGVYFILDLIVTVMAVAHINREAGARQLELDGLSEIRAQYLDELRRKAQKRRERFLVPFSRRLLKAFPSMRSQAFPDGIKELLKNVGQSKKGKQRK